MIVRQIDVTNNKKIKSIPNSEREPNEWHFVAPNLSAIAASNAIATTAAVAATDTAIAATELRSFDILSHLIL